MIRLRSVQADITTLAVDAVVNAANSSLMGGAGVDGAIHSRGGPTILTECRQIVARSGPLPVGDAVATTAGLLPARVVIHTVGPRWAGDPEQHDRDLASCYRSSLDLAAQELCASIAFPCISTGLYGFPVARAADIAIGTVRAWSDGPGVTSAVAEVTFACFSAEDLAVYRERGVGG